MVQTGPDEPDEQIIRAQQAQAKATSLFPRETWLEIEERIFLAESSQPRGKTQHQVLHKELAQARILTAQGSTVYLLPEIGPSGIRHPDAVVDGYLMEFKTITGTIREVERRFKAARHQADRVFLKIDAPLTQEAVLRKIIDKTRKSDYSGGLVIVHFTATGKPYCWNIDRLH
jgi:hypothetical protein